MWDASGKKNYCWHCEHILTTNKDLLRMAYQRVTTFIHILRQVWQFRTGLFAPFRLGSEGKDLRHHVWFVRVVTSLPLGFSDFLKHPSTMFWQWYFSRLQDDNSHTAFSLLKNNSFVVFFSFPELGESNSYSFSTKARRKKESEQFRSRLNCAIGCPYQQNLNEVKQHARLTTFPKKYVATKSWKNNENTWRCQLFNRLNWFWDNYRKPLGMVNVAKRRKPEAMPPSDMICCLFAGDETSCK